MEDSPELRPVVEVSAISSARSFPWPFQHEGLPSFFRIDANTPSLQIGRIFCQLVDYNRIGGEAISEIESGLLAADALILPGGIQARSFDGTISPGCCCGLESWREWNRFLSGGPAPWLGHDPTPWVEFAGDRIRIWSDSTMASASAKQFSIEFTLERIEAELAKVEKNLREFLISVETWMYASAFDAIPAICRKLDQTFEVGVWAAVPEE